jgi:hypothetical protein
MIRGTIVEVKNARRTTVIVESIVPATIAQTALEFIYLKTDL